MTTLQSQKAVSAYLKSKQIDTAFCLCTADEHHSHHTAHNAIYGTLNLQCDNQKLYVYAHPYILKAKHKHHFWLPLIKYTCPGSKRQRRRMKNIRAHYT